MRILLLSPAAPSKSHVNGGATRMHRLYSGLIGLGHEVTLVAPFTQNEPAAAESLRADGFTVREHLRPASRLLETASAIARRPGLLRAIFRDSVKELIARILWIDLHPLVEEELRHGGYELAVIEGSFAAAWRGEFEVDFPVVLVTHEVESVQLLTKAARIGGLAGFARYLNGVRTRRSERRWTPEFDGVVVMSEEEDRALVDAIGDGVSPARFVVGNGTDIDRLAAVGSDPDEQRVLFTGTLAFPPNIVGAEWLAREVWPKVLKELPKAKLVIVGSSPPRAVRQLAQLPSVELHADVKDMRPWFEQASVCAVPMVEGGGTRLKLLDAFASSRAVVSTTNGATGIDCQHGRELLIADAADDFARATVRLLSDSALRSHLAGRGRQLVEDQYDWRALSRKFETALFAVQRRVLTPNNELRRTAEH